MTSSAEVPEPRARWGWLRALSLAVAGVVSLALMLDPYLVRNIPGARLHDALPLMMFGTAGLFVYGFGFAAETRAVRIVFHPATAWALFLAGIVAIACAV